jgi:hypothetical protein
MNAVNEACSSARHGAHAAVAATAATAAASACSGASEQKKKVNSACLKNGTELELEQHTQVSSGSTASLATTTS